MTPVRRVLLDECVPARLRREIPGFEVRAVREYGWAGKLDGELLHAADGEFDALVTVDRNLIHQQNLTRLRLALVVLVVHSNSIHGIRPLLPDLLPLLAGINPGQVVHLGPPLDR
jgi:predicted nuclease of predicted toxin-antitoxin system